MQFNTGPSLQLSSSARGADNTPPRRRSPLPYHCLIAMALYFSPARGNYRLFRSFCRELSWFIFTLRRQDEDAYTILYICQMSSYGHAFDFWFDMIYCLSSGDNARAMHYSPLYRWLAPFVLLPSASSRPACLCWHLLRGPHTPLCALAILIFINDIFAIFILSPPSLQIINGELHHSFKAPTLTH